MGAHICKKATVSHGATGGRVKPGSISSSGRPGMLLWSTCQDLESLRRESSGHTWERLSRLRLASEEEGCEGLSWFYQLMWVGPFSGLGMLGCMRWTAVYKACRHLSLLAEHGGDITSQHPAPASMSSTP